MSVKYIIRVYAELIRKGEKTLDEVPEKIREEVRKYLEGNK